MTSYRVTAPAEDQISRILARSANEYGRDRAANYFVLITAAMADVASDPTRLGRRRFRDRGACGLRTLARQKSVAACPAGSRSVA